MKKCANCTYTTENDEKFCPSCGGELIVEATAEVDVPAPKKSSVGQILSIVALISAGVYIVLSLLNGLPIIGFLTAILSFIVGLAGPILAIVGIILSWKNSKLGKILGFVALALFIVAAVISFAISGLTVILAVIPNLLAVFVSLASGAPMYG